MEPPLSPSTHIVPVHAATWPASARAPAPAARRSGALRAVAGAGASLALPLAAAAARARRRRGRVPRRQAAVGAVEGKVAYQADHVERSLAYVGVCSVDGVMEGSETVKKTVTIKNGRDQSWDLDNHGFTRVEDVPELLDFYNERAICLDYYPQCERLVQKVTGASKVFAFYHTVRSHSSIPGARKRRKQGFPVEDPAGCVHVDYSEACAARAARQLAKPPSLWQDPRPLLGFKPLLDMGEIDEHLRNGKRWAIINVWRNLSAEPVQRTPVALCVGASPSAVVLLGPSGAGKSETGNTLLGEPRFQVSAGLESETLAPRAEAVDFGGRDWQVVDTPGYFDTTRSADELEDALAQFAGVLKGRVAALAFVVPYGRFGDAHLRGWRLLRGAFGPKALNHTALVFTSCGNRTEEEVQAEAARLCAKEPPPVLCGVLGELGALGGEAPLPLAAFGQLSPERRSRDRQQLFALAARLEAASGGSGYDPAEFLRARRRRRALAQRAAALASEDERRVVELMLANVEAGMLTDEELQRRLEQAEGLGTTERVVVDFEDRSLGPFRQVGHGYRQPMAVPYTSMRGFVPATEGGNLFMHTGTDSGVHVRHGDRRMGEFQTEPFRLGSGDVEWEATGSGGFLALCPSDPALGPCLERRFARRSTALVRDAFGQDELTGFVGSFVYLRLVDDRPSGWGFVAIDNLAYPVLPDGAAAPTSGAPGTTEAPTSTIAEVTTVTTTVMSVEVQDATTGDPHPDTEVSTTPSATTSTTSAPAATTSEAASSTTDQAPPPEDEGVEAASSTTDQAPPPEDEGVEVMSDPILDPL